MAVRAVEAALTPLGRRARAAVREAAEQGLTGGPRTRVVRGRMAPALVEAAKRRTGIRSDTELLEAALAQLATADDFAARLAELRGSVPPDVDLEY
jgi:hypothetical protein